MLNSLATELHALRYYDKEIWDLIVTTAVSKKKIQNMYFFMNLHQIFNEINNDKEAGEHLYNKLSEQIDKFVEKHHTTDRQWKYSVEKQHKYSLKELIARREEATIDKYA